MGITLWMFPEQPMDSPHVQISLLNSKEDSLCEVLYYCIQQEQCWTRRILPTKRRSYTWELANSANTLVDRNKWINVFFQRLTNSNDSLLNWGEVSEVLKKTFIGSFHGDVGSSHTSHAYKSCLTESHITNSEVRRSLACTNPHKGAGSDEPFPKAL